MRIATAPAAVAPAARLRRSPGFAGHPPAVRRTKLLRRTRIWPRSAVHAPNPSRGVHDPPAAIPPEPTSGLGRCRPTSRRPARSSASSVDPGQPPARGLPYAVTAVAGWRPPATGFSPATAVPAAPSPMGALGHRPPSPPPGYLPPATGRALPACSSSSLHHVPGEDADAVTAVAGWTPPATRLSRATAVPARATRAALTTQRPSTRRTTRHPEHAQRHFPPILPGPRSTHRWGGASNPRMDLTTTSDTPADRRFAPRRTRCSYASRIATAPAAGAPAPASGGVRWSQVIRQPFGAPGTILPGPRVDPRVVVDFATLGCREGPR